METSDSEYFESADEDLSSDQENKKATLRSRSPKLIKARKCSESKTDCDSIENKFSDLSCCDSLPVDKFQDSKPKCSDDNKNTKPVVTDIDASSGAADIKHDNSSSKPSKKLGKKLGQKIISQKLGSKVSGSDTDEIKVCTPSISKMASENPHTFDSKANKTDCAEKNLWEDIEIDWGKEKNMTDNVGVILESSSKKQERPEGKVRDSRQNSLTSGWGDWGTWNVASILSTATHSVSSLTTQVSQGLNNVLETSIGAIDPEEMARLNSEEKQQSTEEQDDEKVENSGENQNFQLGFGLGNFVSGVSQLTKLVETTGTKVISGGLGTLETIGKKTMEVLQEGDPGLKKKRAFLQINQDKPNLSQILREAKEKAEAENDLLEQKNMNSRSIKNYEVFFDDHQGLVHLEALELLSKQCTIKLQTILNTYTGDNLIELQETLDQVKELCEIPDEDDEEQMTISDVKNKLTSAVSEMGITISYDKLLSTWEETEHWLNHLNLDFCNENELHQQAIETLAQLTAQAVEQFHKAGELLLIKEHRSTADEADSLVQLTTTLTSFIGIVAAKFSDKLNSKAADVFNTDMINNLITNVFYEAGNSSTYIQDAFQLLVPVLQVGAI